MTGSVEQLVGDTSAIPPVLGDTLNEVADAPSAVVNLLPDSPVTPIVVDVVEDGVDTVQSVVNSVEPLELPGLLGLPGIPELPVLPAILPPPPAPDPPVGVDPGAPVASAASAEGQVAVVALSPTLQDRLTSAEPRAGPSLGGLIEANAAFAAAAGTSTAPAGPPPGAPPPPSVQGLAGSSASARRSGSGQAPADLPERRAQAPPFHDGIVPGGLQNPPTEPAFDPGSFPD